MLSTALLLANFLVSGSALSLVYNHHTLLSQLHTLAWVAVYGFVSLAMAFALMPTTFVALLSGFLLQAKAIPFVIVSYLFASLIGYMVGKKLRFSKDLKSLVGYGNFQVVTEYFKDNEYLLTAIAKISPIFPFAVTNFLLSATHIAIRPFLLGSFIGMLPRTLLAIYAGSLVNQIYLLENALGQGWFPYAILSLVLVSLYVFARLGKELIAKLKKAKPKQ